MAIRKILSVIAVLIVLAGVSQLVFASWWLDRLPGLVDSRQFYLWGLIGILFGVVLLIGVLEKAVGLRAFLTLIALLSLTWGGVTLVKPEAVVDFMNAVVLFRTHGVQVAVMWVTGAMRVAIGFALMYALIRPSPLTREPEPPPSPELPVEQ